VFILAFWLFVNFIKREEPNADENQSFGEKKKNSFPQRSYYSTKTQDLQ